MRAVFKRVGLPAKWTVPALLSLGAFALYLVFLVPGVLSGDAGELAYHPALLGIPHPTGYPLYLLLGRVWLWIMPWGELAWRMNVFSAIWGALAVGWLTALLWRRLPAWAAVAGGLALAVTHDMWRYSTETAVYSLHAFLFVFTLERFERWIAARERGEDQRGPARWVFFALGLGIANHPTFALIGIGFAIIWLLWLYADGREFLHVILVSFWPIFIPALTYIYFPLRAAALSQPNPFSFRALAPAVREGLISPFYTEGFVRYVTGRALLPGFRPEGWVEIPALWLERVFWPLGIGWLIALVVGLIVFIRWRPRLAAGLVVVYTLSGTLALKYWQDFAAVDWIAHLAGHLMNVHVLTAVLLAIGLAAVASLMRSLVTDIRDSRPARIMVGTLVVALLFIPSLVDALGVPPTADSAESRSIQSYWDEALRHPLPEGAALMAHWGDLTPFWYQQYALGRRPDLAGIFPPGIDLAESWLESGRGLYLSGPVIDEVAFADQFHLTPDGIFVRVEPADAEAQDAGPPADAPAFGNGLQLVETDVPQTIIEGEQVFTALHWLTDSSVPRDLLLNLQLVDANERVVAAWERRFASLWDPRSELPAGQRVISRPLITMPWGLAPGEYTLTVRVFEPATSTVWPAPPGSTTHGWPLTDIEIRASAEPPASLSSLENQHVSWENGVRLLTANLFQQDVYPGQKVPLVLLWGTQPGDGEVATTAHLTLTDSEGGAVQSWDVPLEIARRWEGDTAGLRRATYELTIGSSVPAGEYTLAVALPDVGEAKLGLFQRQRQVPLGTVTVAERERIFEVPADMRSVDANFGDVITLAGYQRSENTLRLAWKAQKEVPLTLHVFTHILDEDGDMVAQADHAPQNGRAPTAGWVAGEVVVDEVQLPVTPETGWTIRVGLYDPVSGARLPRATGGDAVYLPVE